MIALILGGAPSVWDEAAAAQALLGDRHLIVAANLASIHWPGRLDATATLHPEHLANWVAQRKARKAPPAARYFVPGGLSGLPWADKAPDRWNGSSGLYAAQVALFDLGAAAVVLCGVPMISEAGHFDRPEGEPWESVASYRIGFTTALREVGGRIRSLDGWTAEVFGRPTPEWAAAVANLKPLGATESEHARIERMHEITNAGKVTARFWAPDEKGQHRLHILAPGESVMAEIDPAQPKFNGGGLKVQALGEDGAPKPARKPAPKTATRRKANPAPPAQTASSEA